VYSSSRDLETRPLNETEAIERDLMKQSGSFFFYWRDKTRINAVEILFWPVIVFITAKVPILQFEYKYIVFTRIHRPQGTIAAKNCTVRMGITLRIYFMSVQQLNRMLLAL